MMILSIQTQGLYFCLTSFFFFLFPMLGIMVLINTGNDTRISHNDSFSSPMIHIQQSQNNNATTTTNNMIAINSLKLFSQFFLS